MTWPDTNDGHTYSEVYLARTAKSRQSAGAVRKPSCTANAQQMPSFHSLSPTLCPPSCTGATVLEYYCRNHSSTGTDEE